MGRLTKAFRKVSALLGAILLLIASGVALVVTFGSPHLTQTELVLVHWPEMLVVGLLATAGALLIVGGE